MTTDTFRRADHRPVPTSADQAEASAIARRAPSEAQASCCFPLDIAHSPSRKRLSKEIVGRGTTTTKQRPDASFSHRASKNTPGSDRGSALHLVERPPAKAKCYENAPVERFPRRVIPQRQKRPDASFSHRASNNTPGSDLLSHTVAHAVPSAVEGLTAVFGMGTGVTPLLCPPGTLGAGSSALVARGQPRFEERSLHRREPCATTEYPTNDSSQPLAPSAARPAPAMIQK